jgi:hypothetical protein
VHVDCRDKERRRGAVADGLAKGVRMTVNARLRGAEGVAEDIVVKS